MASQTHSFTLDPETPIDQRVSTVLERLRPMLRNDGGDIELLGIDDQGVVKVRLLGACIGCPSSFRTLTMGIERNLRELVPEVTRVVCA